MQSLDTLTAQHKVFGYAGLIPFVGLSIALIILGEYWQNWLLSYAALIFSFLGGMLWAYSLKQVVVKHCAWVGIGCMLWAWLWLVCELKGALFIAALSFMLLWLYEHYFLRQHYPDGFMKLRSHLSLTASGCLALSGFITHL